MWRQVRTVRSNWDANGLGIIGGHSFILHNYRNKLFLVGILVYTCSNKRDYQEFRAESPILEDTDLHKIIFRALKPSRHLFKLVLIAIG